MSQRNLFRFAVIVLCALVLALPALAALTGDLQGTIFDPKGLAVSEAVITIKNAATGVTRTVKTNNEGEFAASQLDIGEYEVRVEKQGFRLSDARVVIRSGEVTRLNVSLEVGAVSEVVTVEAGASTLLDTASAQVSTSLDDKTVKELPSFDRDPVAFATLAPGIVPVSKDNPFLGSGSFNSNGQRGRGNNITVDNITATDISTTGSSGTGTFSLDSVQEIKLITNSFSAEFGRNSSAQLQIITKSGGNDYHGTAYWFHQNTAFNARDFFDPFTTDNPSGQVTPSIQNSWGFTATGPILKNHLFASGHYEGIHTRGAGSTNTANVLTTAQVAGITDPTSQAVFSAVGSPSSGTGTFSSAAPNAGNQYSWSLKIDETFRGGKDMITARYGTNPVTSVSPGLTFIGTRLPNYGANVVATARAFNIGYTRAFTPAVINQFRFAFGRSNPTVAPNTTLQPPFAPHITIAGLDAFGISRILPQGRVQNTFQYSDSLSWTRGRHSLKFGADVFRYQANSFFDANFRGRIDFSSVTNFQQGTPSRWRQNFGSSVRGNRSTDIFGFAQDDLRVTSTITLNLGVRFESSGGVSEVNGILSNLNLDGTAPLGGGGTGPLGTLDLGGQAFARNNNWAPRLGIAWNPNHGKLVVRGGYGWAYDYIFLNPITNLRFSAPFVPSIDFRGPFTGVNSWANFVAGTAQVQQDASAAVGQFLSTQTNFGSISPVQQDLKNPRTQQWNVGIEYQLMRDLVMKATYIGAKSDFLEVSQPINPVATGIAPATSEADELSRMPQFTAVSIGESGTPTGSSNRLDPRFNVVTQIQSTGTSNYHGFQLELLKRFSRGYSFDASYTLGHSLDDVSDVLGVLVNDSAAIQDPRNLRDNYANSQFDIRHRFVMNHLWELPLGRHMSGLAGRVLGGWAFNGIMSIQSGFPTSIFATNRRGITDILLVGDSFARANGDATAFTPVPDGSAAAGAIPAPCSRGVNTSATTTCTNTSGFSLTQPLLGNAGTSSRNALRLDNLVNFDWAVLKNTKVTEKVTVQFRWEAYNLFNHANFSGFVNDLTSSSFGVYSSTATDQRKMQMSLKFLF